MIIIQPIFRFLGVILDGDHDFEGLRSPRAHLETVLRNLSRHLGTPRTVRYKARRGQHSCPSYAQGGSITMFRNVLTNRNVLPALVAERARVGAFRRVSLRVSSLVTNRSARCVSRWMCTVRVMHERVVLARRGFDRLTSRAAAAPRPRSAPPRVRSPASQAAAA